MSQPTAPFKSIAALVARAALLARHAEGALKDLQDELGAELEHSPLTRSHMTRLQDLDYQTQLQSDLAEVLDRLSNNLRAERLDLEPLAAACRLEVARNILSHGQMPFEGQKHAPPEVDLF